MHTDSEFPSFSMVILLQFFVITTATNVNDDDMRKLYLVSISQCTMCVSFNFFMHVYYFHCKKWSIMCIFFNELKLKLLLIPILHWATIPDRSNITIDFAALFTWTIWIHLRICNMYGANTYAPAFFRLEEMVIWVVSVLGIIYFICDI